MRLVNFHNIISECLNKFLVIGIGDISVCKVCVLKFVVFIAAASLLLYMWGEVVGVCGGHCMICLAKNTSGDLKIKKKKNLINYELSRKLRLIRND